MLIAVVILACTVLACLVVGVVLVVRGPRPAPRIVGRTVVVHTRRPDDQTIRGVLHGEHTDRWVLRDAVHVHAGGETPAGGLVHIPVQVIAWAQDITGQVG